MPENPRMSEPKALRSPVLSNLASQFKETETRDAT